MDNYDERVDVITSRTVAAMYGLWSAMLTAHTVLLSVAVALPAIMPNVDLWKSKLLGISATVCIVALVFNFATARYQYEILGKRIINHNKPLTEAQRKTDIAKAIRRHALIRYAELITEIGLILEACVLIGVIF